MSTIYSIDYRNGAMGSTMVSHALYACGELDIDPKTIFSKTGNAHEKLNTMPHPLLTTTHLQDYDTNKRFVPIIEVICPDWDELLRLRMSYVKWHQDFPTAYNLKKFGYPKSSNNNDEQLAMVYETMLNESYSKLPDTVPKQTLSGYILGNYSTVKNTIQEKFGWYWDNNKSDLFFDEVRNQNFKHIKWLEQIKQTVNDCVNNKLFDVELEFFERAMVIAKVCNYYGTSVRNLHWNDYGCFLEKNSLTLIESIERINHGKTI
jgi:hypothetical protein